MPEQAVGASGHALATVALNSRSSQTRAVKDKHRHDRRAGLVAYTSASLPYTLVTRGAFTGIIYDSEKSQHKSLIDK
jgi:hypothetical protein